MTLRARLLSRFTNWALAQNPRGGYAGEDDERWAYTIVGEDGSPYLTRVLFPRIPERVPLVGGLRPMVHKFHRPDGDHQLHNHPWAGTSLILAGGYREERRVGQRVEERVYRPGDVSVLEPNTFHRIDLLEPERGCWTLFSIGPRVQSWGFWDRDGGAFTPWREALAARGLA